MQTPQKIGAYKIVSTLGSGNMGAVYLAERVDGQFQKKVAIKVIKSDRFDYSELLSRFSNERSILAKLEHPNIARLLDSGEDSDSKTPYFIMEYIDGDSIDLYCRKHNLSIKQRLMLFQQVCSAISYAHKNLIIHRDIKPNNILVTTSGDVKILDFGIAKLVEADPNLDLKTTRNQAPFTPRYASPEQVSNETLTTATDVYSLGTLLYELLTDVPIYGEIKSNYDLAKKILNEQPENPSAVLTKKYDTEDSMSNQQFEATVPNNAASPQKVKNRPNLSKIGTLKGDLDTIVLKALRKNPEKRYASVGDFSTDIHLFLGGFPILAKNMTTAYKLKKWIVRQKALATLGLFTFLIIAFSIFFLIDRNRQLEKLADQNRQVALFFSSLFQDLDPFVVQSGELSAKDILEKAFEGVKSSFSNHAQTKLALLKDVSQIYFKLGEFDKVESILIEAQEALKLYDNSEISQEFTIKWIKLHLAKSRIEQARDLFSELEQVRMLPHIQYDWHLLRADMYYFEGKYDLLIKEINLAKPFATNLSVLKQYELKLLECKGNLRLDKYKYTLALAEELLEFIDGNSKILGKLKSSVYTIAGEAYHESSDYENAQQSFEKAMNAIESVTGQYHPDYFNALNSLATTFQYSGQLDKTINALKRSQEIIKKIYGENHPDLAVNYSNMASLYTNIDKVDIARRYFRMAIEIYTNHFGEIHPKVSNAMTNLATSYAREGKFDQSIPLQKRAIEIDLQTIGPDHSRTLRHRQDLAIDLIESGKVQDGVKIAQDVHRKTISLFGSKNEKSAWTSIALGDGLMRLNRLEEAKRLFLKAEEIFLAKRAEDNYQLPYFLRYQVRLALKEKRYSEAINLGERILKNIETNKGQTYHRSYPYLRYLGDAYLGLGERSKALEYYRKAVETAKSEYNTTDSKSEKKVNELQ
ncbi:MAG: serine/threonine protein kinase [Pseudobacteriovorax sp.]|nr:serine/threonine protein kinase [Pseudobacteriovorax sp.]